MNNYSMDIPPFIWWMGIVEDRIDPAETGRVRVRIFGYHSPSTAELPTSELPYATIMNPVTSSGMNGIMEMPNIVKGSTVVGFFTDADQQVPIIMGTIAGKPTERNFPEGEGFYDPKHVYPKEPKNGYSGIGESDISRLARGEAAEEHFSLTNLREKRDVGIPVAAAGSVAGILDDKDTIDYLTDKKEKQKTWDEPHPRGVSKDNAVYYNIKEKLKSGEPPTGEETSLYPYNLVKETEAGIVQELDNTPGNIRIHEFHPSGTNREIQNDGTRVTNIVGSDYEIIVKDKNVLVRGAANVTIAGDAKLKIDGNYYTEVKNDWNIVVGGDKIETINGNHAMNIGTDQMANISGSRYVDIASGDDKKGGDFETIVGSQTTSIGAVQKVQVGGDGAITIKGNLNLNVGKTFKETVGSDGKVGGGKISAVRDNYIIKQTSDVNVNGVENFFLIESKGTQNILSYKEQHLTVGTAQTLTVGNVDALGIPTPIENTTLGRQMITVKENQVEGITGTKTDTIGGTLTSTIGGTHTLTSPTAAITYNAGEITVNSITQTAHTHPQNNGNDAGGGTSTSGPEG